MRGSLLAILLFPFLSIAQIDVNFFLIARNTGQKIMATNDTIGTMGYALDLLDNPEIPGPTLEFNEGDSVHIDLWNVSQGAPHTIHLHGLDVDQENDGVPHLSFEVYHMDHGNYYFKAPHAGTYLYHCHVVSSVHVQAGMYGMIIVHPSDGSQKTWDGGYDYDVSLPLMFSEIDTVWHNDSTMKHAYDTSLTVNMIELPVYDPQYFLVNGFSDGQIDTTVALNTSVGAVNYMRLVNIGFKGVRVIFPPVFGAQTVASDGRPLPSVQVGDTVEIYPGERYGVLGTMPAEGTDLITVEYFDLNTGILDNTQEVPINVVGFVSLGAGIEEGLSFSVVPNPFSGDFIITAPFDINSTVEVRLLDITGNLIDVIQAETQIETSSYTRTYSNPSLPSGIYIVQLVADGVVRTQKVVKTK